MEYELGTSYASNTVGKVAVSFPSDILKSAKPTVISCMD